MGLFDFAVNIGKKLFDSENEAPVALQKAIEEDNPGVENLQVRVKDGKAVLFGTAKSAEALEKGDTLWKIAENAYGNGAPNTKRFSRPIGKSSRPRTRFIPAKKSVFPKTFDSRWCNHGYQFSASKRCTIIFKDKLDSDRDGQIETAEIASALMSLLGNQRGQLDLSSKSHTCREAVARI